MEVKTVYGIMDIYIGAIFAEVYGSISRLGVVIIWEVISEPEVEEYSDGSKFISWLSRNTKTGEEKKIGINDHAIHYSSHIYPINHPKIKRYIESLK